MTCDLTAEFYSALEEPFVLEFVPRVSPEKGIKGAFFEFMSKCIVLEFSYTNWYKTLPKKERKMVKLKITNFRRATNREVLGASDKTHYADVVAVHPEEAFEFTVGF